MDNSNNNNNWEGVGKVRCCTKDRKECTQILFLTLYIKFINDKCFLAIGGNYEAVGVLTKSFYYLDYCFQASSSSYFVEVPGTILKLLNPDK